MVISTGAIPAVRESEAEKSIEFVKISRLPSTQYKNLEMNRNMKKLSARSLETTIELDIKIILCYY